MTAYAKKADEGSLGKLIVETAVLLSIRGTTDAGDALKTAAKTYKVDDDAILRKVRYEFTTKEKAKKAPSPAKAPGKSKQTA